MKSILIIHLNHSNRIRNEHVMSKIQKLIRIGNQNSTCTGTPLTCTGTCWPKTTRTQHVPVQVQGVPLHVTENCPECVFFTHFSIFFYPINSILHIHLKTISYASCNLFSIQFLFQYLSLLQKSFMNFSLTTLIWVITHTQPKHDD